jgi:DNA uptake protein ComE-like DNA-binding protein
MNQTPLKQPSTSHVAVPLARLSGPHGYRFDGDRAHLHTRFVVLDDAAHQQDWALQLWACASAPTSSKTLSGHVVAEVALPPMSEVADETEQVDMDGFAHPPAGTDEYIMALVLASGRPGQFDEVHDVDVYPQPQRFFHPRIRGAVNYRVEGNRVYITVEHIENARNAMNVSGTLAVELWALPKPYEGGAFHGTPLAGVVIGSLTGQTESNLTSFDLPFTRPADGVWHFALMLREWTAAGYITRDYTNFLRPVSYEPEAPVKPVSAQPLAAAKPITVEPTAPSKVDVLVQSRGVSMGSETKPGVSPTKAGTSPGETTTQAKTPAASIRSRSISINTGTEAELCSIEGLTPKLSQSIIKKRPFASLDDLRHIKGISAKLLAAIRSRLTI